MLIEDSKKIKCLQCKGKIIKLHYDYICEDCNRKINFPQKTEKKKSKRKVIFKTSPKG